MANCQSSGTGQLGEDPSGRGRWIKGVLLQSVVERKTLTKRRPEQGNKSDSSLLIFGSIFFQVQAATFIFTVLYNNHETKPRAVSSYPSWFDKRSRNNEPAARLFRNRNDGCREVSGIDNEQICSTRILYCQQKKNYISYIISFFFWPTIQDKTHHWQDVNKMLP